MYEKFKDENAFRKDFLRPLLNKLGFFLVTEYHGTREFGKDFVFAELSRFGGLRHYGAQAKHEIRISQGAGIDDLMSQIHQAFANPFTLPDSKEESYISALYIFNSGRITQNAKDDFISRLRKTTYGENVFFLDGERLDSLNKWTTYQNDQNVRARLIGFKNQLIFNINTWTILKESAINKNEYQGRKAILAGIEEFLSSPIFYDKIPIKLIEQLWEYSVLIEILHNRKLVGFITPDAKERDSKVMCKTIDEAIPLADILILAIDSVMSELKPF